METNRGVKECLPERQHLSSVSKEEKLIRARACQGKALKPGRAWCHQETAGRPVRLGKERVTSGEAGERDRSAIPGGLVVKGIWIVFEDSDCCVEVGRA